MQSNAMQEKDQKVKQDKTAQCSAPYANTPPSITPPLPRHRRQARDESDCKPPLLLVHQRASHGQALDLVLDLVKLLDGVDLPLAAHVPRLPHPHVFHHFSRIGAKATADARVARSLQPVHALLLPGGRLLVARLEVLQHLAIELVEGVQVDREVLRVLVPALFAEAGWASGRDWHHWNG